LDVSYEAWLAEHEANAWLRTALRECAKQIRSLAGQMLDRADHVEAFCSVAGEMEADADRPTDPLELEDQ
jgi:hypothetical protein